MPRTDAKSAAPKTPLRAKHLGKALRQLAEEAAGVFKPMIGTDWIVGVVGALQFDVLADRIRTEYDVPVCFEPTDLYTARWIEADDRRKLKAFIDANRSAMSEDHDGDPVFLARNIWHLDRTRDDYPDIRFREYEGTSSLTAPETGCAATPLNRSQGGLDAEEFPVARGL